MLDITVTGNLKVPNPTMFQTPTTLVKFLLYNSFQ